MNKATAFSVAVAVVLGLIVAVSASEPRTGPRYNVINEANTQHQGRGTPGKPCSVMNSCEDCTSLLYCEWCPEDKKCFDIPRPGYDLPHPCKGAQAGIFKSNPQSPWCTLPHNKLSSSPLEANIDRHDMHGKLVTAAEQKEEYSDLIHHDAMKLEIEKQKEQLQQEEAVAAAAVAEQAAPAAPAAAVEPVSAF